jgi:hypothetical protein
MKQARVNDRVNYVLESGPNKGDIRPAIVVLACGSQCVNLQVFSNGPYDALGDNVVWRGGVKYSEKIPAAVVRQGRPDNGTQILPVNTWHWPELQFKVCAEEAFHASAEPPCEIVGQLQKVDATDVPRNLTAELRRLQTRIKADADTIESLRAELNRSAAISKANAETLGRIRNGLAQASNCGAKSTLKFAAYQLIEKYSNFREALQSIRDESAKEIARLGADTPRELYQIEGIALASLRAGSLERKEAA